MATIDKVREVRARSGVGLDTCKKALDAVGDDVEQALVWLQKQGAIKGADRSGRIATEGRVFTYVHGGGSKVAVVEINCETDFAAKSSEFVAFGDHVAMHIIAATPTFRTRDDVNGAVRSYHRSIFLEQVPEDKPAAVREKIIEGKLDKWLSEVCLMDQESAIEPGKTIEQLRVALVAQLGENVTIRRYLRWEVGEGV